ncbi:cuticle protein 6 [Trichonephila clavata]|uniref:Cuticle protein 6 n=1 Tax=Trichonephila clavata TaxID=2740835 RepID=A0A8X6IL65_TRICU|nr:cuticle protein 6 [Trichonephila clavata]
MISQVIGRSSVPPLSIINDEQDKTQHQNNRNNNAAPLHYVNIGAQLQGDYKFGYNTGNDGSFREETRNPDGSVSGAYGYIDASGKQKIIRYTAGKDGSRPKEMTSLRHHQHQHLLLPNPTTSLSPNITLNSTNLSHNTTHSYLQQLRPAST